MHPSLAERLEKGELVALGPCPFALPTAAELAILREQSWQTESADRFTQPTTTADASQECPTPTCADRLLGAAGEAALAWLRQAIPQYQQAAMRHWLNWRVDEEATRPLPVPLRNDLLHIDASLDPPTRGARILTLCVNLNPVDDWIWATSETFDVILANWGRRIGLPRGDSWPWRFGQRLWKLFGPAEEAGEFDRFMHRFERFLKQDESYQDRAPRRIWRFCSGHAWLACTDGLSHAELRGRFKLEITVHIPPPCLARPDLAPVAILENACGGRAPLAA